MNKYKLGEVCKVKGGYAFKSTQFTDNGIPLIRIGNIVDNRVRIEDVCIARNDIDKYNDFIVNNGDVLVALSGATTGKFGIYTNNKPALLNQRVARIVPKEVIDNKYLYHYMNTLQSTILEKAMGAAQPNISTRGIEMLDIYVPSLCQQNKIADTLDKGQELIDKRKEQIAACDELIKSLFYHMFGDPIMNDRRWEKKSIGNRFIVKTGATPSRQEKIYWGKSTVPWVKTAELTESLIIESEEYLTDLGCANSSVSLFPKETILIAMYGQGKTRGMTGKLSIEATTNQACAALLPNSLDNQDFVWSQLKLLYNELRNLGRGGNQPNLNLNLVKSFEIIVPPLTLQNQFAQKVEKIEQQKQLLQQSRTELETNFNALMQRAFNGELF